MQAKSLKIIFFLTIRNKYVYNIVMEDGMTKLELERKFKKAGWRFVHGSNHDKAISPDGKKTIPIPRHRGGIKKGLALAVLKEAGLL